jgi:hypothetical protein
MLETPVAFLIYKRPELTARVWSAIRAARPRRLFVIADGPKDASESSACVAARRIVEQGVDWDCAVATDFAAANLGLARRVSSGLSWVFSQVDRAIVLEDDTLPDASFFPYCEALLEHYESDARVMHIGGTNIVGSIDTPYSYGFTKHAIPPWGWASWARAWEKYDLHLTWWKQKRRVVEEQLGPAFRLWDAIIDGHDVGLTTWDVPWAATLWGNAGLATVPRANLVSNLGFGEGATFTTRAQSQFANRERAACELPLSHPPAVVPGFDALIEPALTPVLAEFLPLFRSLARKPG